MARRIRPVQPILGLVASSPKPLTPSQRELVRRAGTHLSIQQQQSLRRQARAQEARHAEVVAEDRATLDRVAALMPKLGKMR